MIFKDKDIVLANESERLLIKGFEQIWMSVRDTSTLKCRQLEESIKYLEAQVSSLKKESQETRLQL